MCGNFNLWKNLFSYDELRINMRQKTDPKFFDLLADVRLGFLSEKSEIVCLILVILRRKKLGRER